MNPKNFVFTEKYRPKTVKEVINKEVREKIQKYLKDPKSLPNFLFYSSSPGCGKTSLAKAIVHDLGCDYIIINSSDDRTLEVIRDKVKEFALTKSTKEGMKRCIILDEFDSTTSLAQQALRNIFETYSANCFFILSCNQKNRVIEPIQSRCVLISFAYPDRDEIESYLTKICVEEVMGFSELGIRKVIELNYPSIRNCVITLQDLKTEGKDVVPENVRSINHKFEDLWNSLMKNNIDEIKKVVMESTIDSRELNTFFWKKAVDNADIRLIQITCRNEKDIANGSDPKIIIVSSLYEMVK